MENHTKREQELIKEARFQGYMAAMVDLIASKLEKCLFQIKDMEPKTRKNVEECKRGNN